MSRHLILSIAFSLFYVFAKAQGSVSATYTTGDIPTSFSSFDATCNGNNIILQVTLPAGDAITVNSINISYSMTALGSAFMSHQRSQVKCVNTNSTEGSIFAGSGGSAGTFNYNRTLVNIANGTYPGGTVLSFEMHAWRTSEITPGCNTTVNRVNAGSWTITVNYGPVQQVGKTGINKTNPLSVLDVNGKIKLGDDVVAPQAGMIRWNSTSTDFEGYNGTTWVSLTNKGGQNAGWGNNAATENYAYSNAFVANDFFGYRVAMDGLHAMAGASGKDVGVNVDQGRVNVFRRTGNNWVSQGTITASDGAAGDEFGFAMSISGDYAIVSSVNKNVGGNAGQGKAYIFFYTAGNWTQQAMLTASDGATGDSFGRAVSISGDYAIVGAFYKTVGANTRQGKAYIFRRSGTTWSQQAMLTASDGAALDDFGWSVGISGTYAIVGAHGKDIGGIDEQGKAYVFNRVGTSWNEQATLTVTDGADGDRFGYSVGISGDYAIVGADGKAVGSNSNQGKAYIFKRVGSSWSEHATLVASDAADNDFFGTSVSISGDYAIVGEPFKTIHGNANQGKVYIFSRTGDVWTQQGTLAASDGAAQDSFGEGVAISGENIIVGADGKNSNAGKIYFFNRQ